MEVLDLQWHLLHSWSFAGRVPTSLPVFKHVFFVGNPEQFVDGLLVGTPVPNVNQNCTNMQHEITRIVRSVSPTPQDQIQASGWPGALSPKGWVIAASHRIYE